MSFEFKKRNDTTIKGTFTNNCDVVPTVMYYRELGSDMINYGEFKEVSFKYDLSQEILSTATFRCATGDRTITFNSDMDDFHVMLGDFGDMSLQEFYILLQFGIKEALRGE